MEVLTKIANRDSGIKFQLIKRVTIAKWLRGDYRYLTKLLQVNVRCGVIMGYLSPRNWCVDLSQKIVLYYIIYMSQKFETLKNHYFYKLGTSEKNN